MFQKYVNTVFKDLILQGYVFLYLDDFIIPAKTDDEALQRLKLVFAIASEYGLEINFKKCSFLSKKKMVILLKMENYIPLLLKLLRLFIFQNHVTTKTYNLFLVLPDISVNLF